MMHRYFVVLAIVFLIDLYAYRVIKFRVRKWSPIKRKRITYLYWGVSGLLFVLGFVMVIFGRDALSRGMQAALMGTQFVLLFTKLSISFFQIVNDIISIGQWVKNRFLKKNPPSPQEGISRKEFLTKAGLVTGAFMFSTYSFGILSGAYDYRVRRRTIVLPNLPKAFDGIRIAQLSDIHSGSFYNKVAVKGGVDMLLQEKPDVVLFTGDLVNDRASEMKEYVSIFNKVQADLGTYSVLGNHDYGDYYMWESEAAKVKNLEKLKAIHGDLGWDLLLNENRTIIVDNESIGLIGIENWGDGQFSKHGDMKKAIVGMEDQPVKLLMSHDPSHWDAEVLKDYKDIDVTFAGHTHGFQMGIEIGDFRWSPAKYRYKRWADLYTEGNQHLYVNRGYGFLGYPGRVGILPEITIIELKRS